MAQETADKFTHVDYANRMALVATIGIGAEEQIVGVVRYERIGLTTAEVAFVIADAWQGRGIATALLLQLAGYARAHGNLHDTPSTNDQRAPNCSHDLRFA